MSKYVVFVDTRFYPYVDDEFDTLEEAQKRYDEMEPYDEDVYLCEIIDKKSDFQPLKPLVENVFDLLPKEPYQSSNRKVNE